MTFRISPYSDNTGASLDLNGTPVVIIDETGISVGAGRRLAQIVTYQTGAVATGSTIIPLDNTKPQINEGDQYMQLTITPTIIGSTIEVNIQFEGAHSIAASYIIVALFMNLDNDAVASTFVGQGVVTTIPLKYQITTTSLLPIAFKVRVGGTTTGLLTFNGYGGTQSLGGTLSSYITAKEYLP